MISWFSIASVFAAGFSFRARVRDLDDSEVTPAVRKVKQLLKARIHGNEQHLRIEGTYGDSDVAVVVESAREGSRLTVEIPSPRGVSFCIAPRINSNGRNAQALSTWTHPIKALYSEDLLLAGKLVEDASISRTLSKLTAEPRFSLFLQDGSLRLAGLMPEQLSDHSIPELVKDMTRLVQTLSAKPEVKRRVAEDELRAKRHRLSLIGVAGVLTAVLLAFLGYRQHRSHQPSAWLHPIAIPGWHAIQATDIDPEAEAVMQQHGQVFSDRIAGDFTGRGSESGEVAILIRDNSADPGDSKYRFVIQTDPPTRFDQDYSSFAFALKVSNRNLNKMGWIGEKPPDLGPRDAILIVQQRSDVRSGQVLLFDGKEMHLYRPEDYRLF